MIIELVFWEDGSELAYTRQKGQQIGTTKAVYDRSYVSRYISNIMALVNAV